MYGVDVQKELLDRMKNNARRESIFNIEVVWGDLEKLGGTRLRDASMDVALVTNVLFQLEDMGTFLTEVYRIVKPRGKVLLVDWSESFGNTGPPKDRIVSEDKALELFEKHGFTKLKDISGGEHHYGMVLQHE